MINFDYFHTQIGEFKRLINEVSADGLNILWKAILIWLITSLLTLEINKHMMALMLLQFVNTIINDSNAVINALIDSKIEESEEASIRADQQENVFERVMENDLFKEDDSDLHKVGSVNKDYHKVNQKTYLFRIDYNSQIGYYSTRLSTSLLVYFN